METSELWTLKRSLVEMHSHAENALAETDNGFTEQQLSFIAAEKIVLESVMDIVKAMDRGEVQSHEKASGVYASGIAGRTKEIF